MLSEQQLNALRDRLLARRAELRSATAAGEQAAQTVELDQTRVGRLSRMDALQGQAMSVEAQRRRELELRNIAAALSRLKDGDYGFCQNCGEDIASGRLALDPSVALCIGCANAAENG